MLKRIMLGAAAAALLAGPAMAEDFAPAVVYDLGGKFDKSFNESAYTGAEKFKADTGTDYRDFEIQNDSQREQALRNFARRGANPVIAIGFSHANALEKVAEEFPETKFAIVDMVVDQAECALDRLQGERRVLHRRQTRHHGIRDQEGRFCRRHGCSPHPQVRLRIPSRACSRPIPTRRSSRT